MRNRKRHWNSHWSDIAKLWGKENNSSGRRQHKENPIQSPEALFNTMQYFTFRYELSSIGTRIYNQCTVSREETLNSYSEPTTHEIYQAYQFTHKLCFSDIWWKTKQNNEFIWVTIEADGQYIKIKCFEETLLW